MSKSTSFLKKQSGFTMIELLVVTTIIIVLTTIGIVSYQSAGQNARNGKRKADLETVRQALVMYRIDNGLYPIGNTFNTMVLEISEYLSAVTLTDPLNDGQYVYSYNSDTGATFSLTAVLEPGGEGNEYVLTNP